MLQLWGWPTGWPSVKCEKQGDGGPSRSDEAEAPLGYSGSGGEGRLEGVQGCVGLGSALS